MQTVYEDSAKYYELSFALSKNVQAAIHYAAVLVTLGRIDDAKTQLNHLNDDAKVGKEATQDLKSIESTGTFEI